MLINVYDFDNTIYRGDSSFDFFRHCAVKYPRALLPALAAAPWMLGVALGLADKTRAKQRFYRYLRQVPDIAQEVERFWMTHDKNLKNWYFELQKPDDLVISASPEFLLEPVARRLNLRLVASRVDPATGLYQGTNCHGEEKVRRMREAYPEVQIARFFSDSMNDLPLARLAKSAFLVKGDEIGPYPIK